jgi:hypothetical protein
LAICINIIIKIQTLNFESLQESDFLLFLLAIQNMINVVSFSENKLKKYMFLIQEHLT